MGFVVLLRSARHRFQTHCVALGPSVFLPPDLLPPCLLWHGLLGLHLLVPCWRTLFPFPTPMTTTSDPRLLRKKFGRQWQDFSWRVHSFLLPFIWSISAAVLPSSSFLVPGQLLFLLLGAVIFLRSFGAIMCSLGCYMDSISNSSRNHLSAQSFGSTIGAPPVSSGILGSLFGHCVSRAPLAVRSHWLCLLPVRGVLSLYGVSFFGFLHQRLLL